MVKYHSDSERGNTLPPHGLYFRLRPKVLLYAPFHRQDTMAFVTPVVEHWLEREIVQWVLSDDDVDNCDSDHVYSDGGDDT